MRLRFAEEVATTAFGRARQRSSLLDHAVRAAIRYHSVYGGRLAAAIAYYGFFAVFALGVLLFSVLASVLDANGTVMTASLEYLRRSLPELTTTSVVQAGGRVGTFAAIGLVLAGVAWVRAMRSSQRAIWLLEERPGNVLVRLVVDLAVLAGLGALLIVSVSISAGVQDVALLLANVAEPSPARSALRHSGGLLAILVDLVLAAALLAWVPRVRVPWRILAPSAALVALGLGLLKTVGRWYVAGTQHNPAYQVVGGAAGLLVFIYLFNHVLLFAAALAATAGPGTSAGDSRQLAGPTRRTGPTVHTPES